MIKYDFKNKTVVVTGAGMGIGKATALEFAKAGANVALFSRTYYDVLKNEIKKFGKKVKFYKVNVSNELEVFHAVKEVKKDYGKVDILINNASIAKKGKLEELSVEDWDYTMANNVRSCFLCTKAVVPGMKSQKGGKIINISSVAGRDKSMLLGAAYTSSKAAVIGFTRQIAGEVASFGINVNCICPSQTYTPMLTKILTKELKNMLEKKNPSGYIAQPIQIANVILFLASDEANYMNGAIIDVNGGLL